MKPIIDISHIPFSRYGAYVAVTANKEENFLMLHNDRLRCGEDNELKVTFLDGENVLPMDVSATPEKVTVKAGNGSAEIYIRGDRTFVFVSHDVTMRFVCQAYAYGSDNKKGLYQINSCGHHIYDIFRVEKGDAVLAGPVSQRWNNTVDFRSIFTISGDAAFTVTLTPDEATVCNDPICPEKELAEISAEWEKFAAKMPECGKGSDFVGVTWYNLWSSFVHAEDVYHADVMMMAKKFMSSVWSWDHCFNALTMAHVDKQIALDQFNAPFVIQSESGALPDMWNPNIGKTWSVTKPPIHGWCFSKLMKKFDFDRETLERTYGYLEKWTNWWMNYRDFDGDGVPEYPQGCDSGWDNATSFDPGYFMETPDLPSFLILQMKCLAEISEKLGNAAKKNEWNARAEKLLSDFIAHSWNGERFAVLCSHSHVRDDHPTSLISVMPIVLGEILDKDKMEKLVKILKDDFLTENGPATESPKSEKYESDGYWRGPIWAPTTYLIVDGLRRGGYEELAKDIAARYCRMSDTLAKGNYENFDALTGKGLRAPGYTWSASVYMLFRNEY